MLKIDPSEYINNTFEESVLYTHIYTKDTHRMNNGILLNIDKGEKIIENPKREHFYKPYWFYRTMENKVGYELLKTNTAQAMKGAMGRMVETINYAIGIENYDKYSEKDLSKLVELANSFYEEFKLKFCNNQYQDRG